MSSADRAIGLGGSGIPVEEYCREIERYLTRKNDGHLIRIVGPSFDRVCGWASRGIPLQIAHAGIDRHFERYYRKGPRRRPVLIDFCEPDILEVFDDWRRAVGLSGGADERGESRTRESLSRHMERVIARLTLLRTAGASQQLVLPPEALEYAVRSLDALRADARGARGSKRTAALEKIAQIDAGLMAAAGAAAGAATLERLRAEAERELAPFRERMPADQWPRAIAAAAERLLRDRAGLPMLEFE